MNSKVPSEDNFKKLTFEEIIYHAQNAPRVFVDLSASKYEDVSREPGLLLTKEEIIQIKIYEATALALPHTLEDVEVYLNFGDANDAGPGLEYKNFLTLFSTTRTHALRWSPLHNEMKLTGTKLKMFSRSMMVYGDSINELLDGIKSLKKIEKLLEANKIETLAQLKEVEVKSGEKFPEIELEKNTKSDLGNYLSQIFEKVRNHQEETKKLHDSLTSFSDDLHNRILPKIKIQLKLVETNTVQNDIDFLKHSISERSVRIDEKTKEYKALVQKALEAASQFNLPGLGIAIYQGVTAEDTRYERNQLFADQKAEIEKLSKKSQTLASLHKVKLDLQNLDIVTFNADMATQNLRHVWNVIYAYVKQSADSVNNINDALSLGLFMTEFKLVVDPWRDIAMQTDIFIKVFKEADEEYKRIYTDSDNQANHLMEL